MFAQLANLGMTIGGTLMGMNRINDSTDAAMAAAGAASRAQEVGYDKAIGQRKEGLQSSLGFLNPFRESGVGGQNLLNDALGINGPEAQRAYFAGFQNDPGFDAVQRTGLNTVEQGATARGGLYSGSTMKALQDFGMKLQQSVFQDRLARLADTGKIGLTAATGMANINEGAYKDIAGYEVGEGNAKAGGLINASNAQQMGTQNYLQMLGYGMGQARGGINDLFSKFKMPGSTGAGFMSGTPQGVGLGGYAGSY